MKLFHKILIANRGEIACRIIRSCHRLGIATVAVYSDVDALALHVREAGEAVALGDPQPAQSYLNIKKIIAAARETHAEAIHPGYGFLSENADFARACDEAGLVFIGPPPDVIAAMGDKLAAKRTMIEGGVPTLAAQLEEVDEVSAPGLAKQLGYPILLKAAAGGGGKGMRIVGHAGDLVDALKGAQREAAAAFGDSRVFMEKFLEHPRHIEVQILADRSGQIQHLFERDCTVQRRHQKIIEESPSPVLSVAQRQDVCRTAIQAAEAIRYQNAGTIEFLYDSGQFYFLEMNTRLQVEHPITEWVSGRDLVRAQILLAAGQRLRGLEDLPQPRGHALELRIYAEDPSREFLPAAGRVEALSEPTGPGVRVDSSLYVGWDIPVEYDPLLAKLVVWDEDRASAIRRALQALREYRIDGIETNISFLEEVLTHPDFAQSHIDTYWVERTFANWQPSELQADKNDLYSPWIPREESVAAQRRQAFQRDHARLREEPSSGPIQINAPMPGKIIQLTLKAGDSVVKGSLLLVVEAMKMEHSLTAPRDAKVKQLYKKEGDQVAKGDVLIVLE